MSHDVTDSLKKISDSLVSNENKILERKNKACESAAKQPGFDWSLSPIP